MKHNLFALTLGMLFWTGTTCPKLESSDVTSHVTFDDYELQVSARAVTDRRGKPKEGKEGYVEIKAKPGVNPKDFELRAHRWELTRVKKKYKWVKRELTGAIGSPNMRSKMAFAFDFKPYRISCFQMLPVEGKLKRIIDLQRDLHEQELSEKKEIELPATSRYKDLVTPPSGRITAPRRSREEPFIFYYEKQQYIGSRDLFERDGKLYLRSRVAVPMSKYFEIVSHNTESRNLRGKKVGYGTLNMNVGQKGKK